MFKVYIDNTKLLMLDSNVVNMAETIINGREFECNGRSYDIESIIGLTLAKDGVAVTFRDGDVVKMEADATQFSAIGDQCPWAVKYIA